MGRAIVGALVGVVFLGLATQAQATTCTVSSNTCTTTDGLTFTLTNLGLAPDLNFGTDATNDTYKFQLDVNFNNYSGADTDYLDAVALKVTSNYDATSFSTNAPGTWGSHDNTGLNSGCGGGGNGFLCADTSTQTAVLGPTGTYTFFFLFDLGAGGSITTSEVKAEWLHLDKTQAGQLSQVIPSTPGTPRDVPPVPEPTSMLLLGTGLLGAASAGARRLRRR